MKLLEKIVGAIPWVINDIRAEMAGKADAYDSILHFDYGYRRDRFNSPKENGKPVSQSKREADKLNRKVLVNRVLLGVTGMGSAILSYGKALFNGTPLEDVDDPENIEKLKYTNTHSYLAVHNKIIERHNKKMRDPDLVPYAVLNRATGEVEDMYRNEIDISPRKSIRSITVSPASAYSAIEYGTGAITASAANDNYAEEFASTVGGLKA